MCDVKAWVTANMLQLNDNKTELMLVTSNRTKHLHGLPTSITTGNAQISFKQSVKNLGLALDCHLTMNTHVFKKVKLIYHDCLPILMLLCIMLCIVLAYLMLLAALCSAVCLYMASFFAIDFCKCFLFSCFVLVY